MAVVERVGRGRAAWPGVKGRRVYIGRSSSGWTAVGENRDSLGLRKGEGTAAKKSPARGGQGGRRGGGERGTEQRVRETVEVGVKSPTRN